MLLAVTGVISVPGALIAPLLVPRLRNVGWLIAAGVLSFALGCVGLLLAPAPLTLLWVLSIGGGSILFPVCLVLINVRTRTHGGTVALSGFAQGTAYALGALGPLLVGLLHDASGGWTLPLLFLLTVTLARQRSRRSHSAARRSSRTSSAGEVANAHRSLAPLFRTSCSMSAVTTSSSSTTRPSPSSTTRCRTGVSPRSNALPRAYTPRPPCTSVTATASTTGGRRRSVRSGASTSSPYRSCSSRRTTSSCRSASTRTCRSNSSS